MTIDPTTLPECLYEDGSSPGQVFPCGWSSDDDGNGEGTHFVMPAADTFLYPDGTLICPAGTLANDAVDGCVPLTVEPVVLAPLPVVEAGVQVQAAPAPVVELAHTGVDPVGVVVAALMVGVGAVCLILRRLV